VHIDAELLQTHHRALAERVPAQSGEERGLAGQARQLHCGNAPTSGRLLEGVVRMNHLTRTRDVGHARELHPLDMAHHRHPRPAHPHGGSLTQSTRRVIDLAECSPWRALT